MKPSICLFTLSLALVFLFSACQKEPTLTEEPIQIEGQAYADVPQALWDYFRNFEEEAQERGIAIDLSNLEISAEIMEISEDGVAGTCTYGSHQPGHIIIDQEFWNRSSDLFKEMIIFHELGHCSLFQGHREAVNSDGTCASIMRSGLEDCRDNYRLSTRATYLDELFEVQ